MSLIKSNRYHLAGWIVSVLIFLTALDQPAISQNRYAGSWHEVSVFRSALTREDLDGPVIVDFGFKDSLSGLAWLSLDSSKIFLSIDGGHTWSFDTSLGSSLYPKHELNCVEATGLNHGVISNFVSGVISPWGSSIITNAGLDSLGDYLPYLPIAQKMTDTANGYRFVQAVDYHGYPTDSALLIVTHDAWQHAVPYGTAYDFAAIENGFNSSQNFYGGLMLDSNEIWTSDRNIVMHTTDEGSHWQKFLPVDSTKYKPNWINFIAKPSSHEVYVETILSNVDFAYSSDYGNSWRVDSTFGSALWRMAVPAPGIIWAMLGQGPSVDVFINPTNAAYPDLRGRTTYSNKIGYSSDNGATWYIDSTTFAADTLLEMHFTDARHGWIAGIANNDGHIWYYDADDNSSVNNATPKSDTFAVFPNPATNSLNIVSSSGTVSVTDPLGRSYNLRRNESTLDISSLPPGVYFVSDGRERAKFVKE